MLPRNARQEALSRAYVRAVAARAGVICTDLGLDYGIDMCLRSVEQVEHRFIDSGDQIDLQLKCTTRAVVSDTEVVHDLEVRAYEVLRNPRPGCPRLLVLVLLPDDEALWLDQSTDQLVLRRCAYWLSLRGAPAVATQQTTRVSIPQANVFSPEAIQTLMQQVRQGGAP